MDEKQLLQKDKNSSVGSGGGGWDASQVNLFKRQLELYSIEETARNCVDFLDENVNYLIVTGYPGVDEYLASHLWLFFNFLALQKVGKEKQKWSTSIKFFLPSSSRRILNGVFQDIEFGDLSEVLHCPDKLNVDNLLRNSRIIGDFDEIVFDPKIEGNVQMIILNKDSKRLKELAALDLTFPPYRPKFQPELMAKVQTIALQAAGLGINKSTDDQGDGEVGGEEINTVKKTFIGAYSKPEGNVSYVSTYKGSFPRRSSLGSLLYSC